MGQDDAFTESEATMHLHNLVAEGADLPTTLLQRSDFHRPGGEVTSVSSRQLQLTLGRGADCDVQVADDRVSRVHAIVRIDGATATIEDAGSTNGTYVDGVLVAGAVALREGAMVRFGRRGPVFRYGRAFGPRDPVRPPPFG